MCLFSRETLLLRVTTASTAPTVTPATCIVLKGVLASLDYVRLRASFNLAIRLRFLAYSSPKHALL